LTGSRSSVDDRVTFCVIRNALNVGALSFDTNAANDMQVRWKVFYQHEFNSYIREVTRLCS
jgi:hypothetical protein